VFFLFENTAKVDYKIMIYLSQDKELMGYRLLDACPFLAHFVTTRRGGVSWGPYASFNCSPYTQDASIHVMQNQSQLLYLVQHPVRQLVLPHQVHGCEIQTIGADFLTRPQEEQRTLLEGVDALITREPGVCIGVTTADCVPVLLCDVKRRVVAAVHAGWKGTVKHIVALTMQRLHAQFGTEGPDVLAAIGPSISLSSFEVGDDVVEAFREAGFAVDALARRFPVSHGLSAGTSSSAVVSSSVDVSSPAEDYVSGKYHIDLWEANRRELLEAGVPAAQIETAGICTYQHYDQFFSARRLGIDSGRILSGIMIVE